MPGDEEKNFQKTNRRSVNRDADRLAALDRLATDMKNERQNPKPINYDSFGDAIFEGIKEGAESGGRKGIFFRFSTNSRTTAIIYILLGLLMLLPRFPWLSGGFIAALLCILLWLVKPNVFTYLDLREPEGLLFDSLTFDLVAFFIVGTMVGYGVKLWLDRRKSG